jgi:hypothetical protein
MRGVSGDDPEGGAGSGVPRPWHATTGSGGSETARRALRPVPAVAKAMAGCSSRPPKPSAKVGAARSWLHVLRRKWRGRKRGPEAENRHGVERREARRPDRKGRRGASQAPRPAASLQAPVPRKHRASVGAPPTPLGVATDQSSGASRRENEWVWPIATGRAGLFDIVKRGTTTLAAPARTATMQRAGSPSTALGQRFPSVTDLSHCGENTRASCREFVTVSYCNAMFVDMRH